MNQGGINMSISIKYLQLVNIDIFDLNGEYRGLKDILEDVSACELIKSITIDNPVRIEEVRSLVSELRQYMSIDDITICYKTYGYRYLITRLDIYRLSNNILESIEKLKEAFAKLANEIIFSDIVTETNLKNYKKRNKKGKQIKNWQKKKFYD